MSSQRREFLNVLAVALAAGLPLASRSLLAAQPQAATRAYAGKAPHLVGAALLREFNLAPDSSEAYAFTALDFAAAANTYGKVGGFAHLATLIKSLRASRPGALLLDGGDTWQGSATSLWTNAQDMIDASKLLGVEVMTAHWEMTY